jgi:hypothetical protein
MNREKVNTPTKVIGLWEKGVLGRGEFPLLLLKTLTPETTEQFARAVTPPVIHLLLEDMRRAPTTDEEWGHMRVFRAGAYALAGPWTEERSERQQQEERAEISRYRAGVELLRAYHRCLLPGQVIAFDPTWLTSSVLALAEGIYADRAFDRMPILADALQDAGCDNADILAHCRGEGPHVRGCLVVDLLLGKT